VFCRGGDGRCELCGERGNFGFEFGDFYLGKTDVCIVDVVVSFCYGEIGFGFFEFFL